MASKGSTSRCKSPVRFNADFVFVFHADRWRWWRQNEIKRRAMEEREKMGNGMDRKSETLLTRRRAVSWVLMNLLTFWLRSSNERFCASYRPHLACWAAIFLSSRPNSSWTSLRRRYKSWVSWSASRHDFFSSSSRFSSSLLPNRAKKSKKKKKKKLMTPQSRPPNLMDMFRFFFFFSKEKKSRHSRCSCSFSGAISEKIFTRKNLFKRWRKRRNWRLCPFVIAGQSCCWRAPIPAKKLAAHKLLIGTIEMPSGERFKCHLVRTRVAPQLWLRWKRPLSTSPCSFFPPSIYSEWALMKMAATPAPLAASLGDALSHRLEVADR